MNNHTELTYEKLKMLCLAMAASVFPYLFIVYFLWQQGTLGNTSAEFPFSRHQIFWDALIIGSLIPVVAQKVFIPKVKTKAQYYSQQLLVHATINTVHILGFLVFLLNGFDPKYFCFFLIGLIYSALLFPKEAPQELLSQ